MSKLVHYPSKHALPRHGNINDLVDHTMHTIHAGLDEIRSSTRIPVIMATIPDMNFAKYSPAYADLLGPLQRVFNSAIIQVNGQIRGANRLAHLDTINLAYPVHRCKGGQGRYTTQYSFLFDGLHPTDELLARWSQSITKSCTHFFTGVTHN